MVGNPELEMDGLFIQHQDEYDFDEQMFVTYTNAAVDEAVDRLAAMTDATKKRLNDRVMTIHGFCFRTLDLDYGSDTVSWRDEQRFCNEHNLEYGNDDDDGDVMTGDLAEGNQLFQIYRWLQSNRYSIDDHDKFPGDWVGHRSLPDLLRQWEIFKHGNDLVGWGDMIDKVVQMNIRHLKKGNVGNPDLDDPREYLLSCHADDDFNGKSVRGSEGFADTKVLYVDECQDLTRLQWDWYLTQKLAADEVYLGGDDDQAIFQWSGADPEQLLNEDGETTVLDTTYRLPRAVWAACESCIEQVEHRQEKDITPRDEEGEFITLSRPVPSQLINHIAESDDVLVLFRARYHIDEFRDQLHDFGIPYDNMSTFQTWKQYVTRMRDALKEVIEGVEISKASAKRIYEACDPMMVAKGSPGLSKYTIQDDMERSEFFELFDWNGDRPIAFVNWYVRNIVEHTDELNWYQGEAIKGNLKSTYRDRTPDQVRVGTIHSAKGKEADTVILGTDSTRTIVENMDAPVGEVDDAERRVLYVGMSRAKRKLVMAEGAVSDQCALRIKALVNPE